MSTNTPPPEAEEGEEKTMSTYLVAEGIRAIYDVSVVVNIQWQEAEALILVYGDQRATEARKAALEDVTKLLCPACKTGSPLYKNRSTGVWMHDRGIPYTCDANVIWKHSAPPPPESG